MNIAIISKFRSRIFLKKPNYIAHHKYHHKIQNLSKKFPFARTSWIQRIKNALRQTFSQKFPAKTVLKWSVPDGAQRCNEVSVSLLGIFKRIGEMATAGNLSVARAFVWIVQSHRSAPNIPTFTPCTDEGVFVLQGKKNMKGKQKSGECWSSNVLLLLFERDEVGTELADFDRSVRE